MERKMKKTMESVFHLCRETAIIVASVVMLFIYFPVLELGQKIASRKRRNSPAG